MKIACVTTTINVPKVLALYAKHGPDVMFFVIGDRKTPDMQVVEFLTAHVPNHAYYGIDRQYQLGWKCARLIPESCIQRRNIGFLEALKWGADVVVSIDDDNASLSTDYFLQYEKLFSNDFSGLQIGSGGWFDYGQWQYPSHGRPVVQRGFPQDMLSDFMVTTVVGAKIGLAQGVCLGNPDTSAVDRLSQRPDVHQVSELLRAGVAVASNTWTICNTQNSAFDAKLTAAMLLVPQFKRYDDILASLVCQRVMHDLGMQVHVGQPFVHQQRNPHTSIQDLKDELWGMTHIEGFAEWLRGSVLLGKLAVTDERPVDKVRAIYQDLRGNVDIPEGVCELAEAWCDDIERAWR